jgi:hypothetical protein
MLRWRTLSLGVLGLTAAAKLLGLIHPAPLLFQPDGVVGVQIIYVVAAACLAELLLCALIAFAEPVWHLSALAAWAVVVVGYRIAAASVGGHCPCLGNVAQWWPWLGRHEGPLLTTVVCWLLITSVAQLAEIGWTCDA